MKKALKILGAAAALTALLPYSVESDPDSEQTTVRALLWKFTSKPNPDEPGKHIVTVDVGFHSPFAPEEDDPFLEEEELFPEEEGHAAEDPSDLVIDITIEPRADAVPEEAL